MPDKGDYQDEQRRRRRAAGGPNFGGQRFGNMELLTDPTDRKDLISQVAFQMWGNATPAAPRKPVDVKAAYAAHLRKQKPDTTWMLDDLAALNACIMQAAAEVPHARRHQ